MSSGDAGSGAATRKGEETRQAILQAAMDLYARNGFRGTPLTAVGERAGVTHAAVLYHFGTARNLLTSVLEERDRRFSDAAAQDWGGDAVAVLMALPRVARFNDENHGLARLFTVLEAENLDPMQEAHDYFVDRRRLVHQLLANMLEQGQAQGLIRPEVDPHVKADEIIAFMEGAQITRFLDPEKVDLVTLYESYTASLLRDLVTDSVDLSTYATDPDGPM